MHDALSPSACILCGPRARFRTKFEKLSAISGDKYEICFCQSCNIGITQPFPEDNELAGLHAAGTYRAHKGEKYVTLLEKAVALSKRSRCRRIERRVASGKLLDIGCGRGDFLQIMRAKGWECVGTEIEESTAIYGNQVLGLDVRVGSLENLGIPDSSFNVITMWHVLEHLKRPETALRECWRILRPGGMLVVAVPNGESVQATISGRHWFLLDVPRHLYHFSSRNLMRLLHMHGFDTITVRHYSLEYNPFGILQSILNLCGFPENLLYDMLRKKDLRQRHHAPTRGTKFYAILCFMFLSLSVLVPLSMLVAIVEAALGRGGTIEVYALKS
jgi:2-polyprenyl-3-methyl-5-hydroxy-6-metoxy-1,4-benzoquinol methylase